jgi:hypothetical protein
VRLLSRRQQGPFRPLLPGLPQRLVKHNKWGPGASFDTAFPHDITCSLGCTPPVSFNTVSAEANPMSLMWCGISGKDCGVENPLPGPRHNEPDPDSPEPDEETQDLVRPLKT